MSNKLLATNKTTFVVILSQSTRFHQIAKSNTISPETRFKQISNLNELFKFTRTHGTADRLIIDLTYAPTINGEILREIRELGWRNLMLILPQFDEVLFDKLFSARLEQFIFLPQSRPHSPLAQRMSEEELIIMQLLADGEKLTQIALKLHYSPQTIRRSIRKMLNRLGYQRRTRLLADLFRQGALK